MKNIKNLFIFTVIMLNVSAYAVNNSLFLPIADMYEVEILVNDTSDNGNVLHKVIKNLDDENFEIIFQVRCKPGILNKDIKAGIQQPPYNKFPEQVARGLYLQDKYMNVDNEIQDWVAINLKDLLSAKDNDGKTPIDLLKESSDQDVFRMSVALEQLMEQTVSVSEQDKKAQLEQRAREQEAQRAMLAFVLLNK